MSTTECCFTNATLMHTKKQKTVMSIFVSFDAVFSLIHAEAMPTEYATWSEGQTLVDVSKE